MTKPAKFTKADVKRAVAGALEGGLRNPRFEIDPTGKIVIIATPTESVVTRSDYKWDGLG